jgi:DNA invertase Pin-like site-specific DNA recombinase
MMLLVHCAVYLRQSQDKANDELAVSRQRADCLKLCKARGWEPVEYVDNDTSASKGRRPDYQRMLQDIRDGRIGAVVAWHLDRLHRQPIELEQFMALADEKRIALATVTGDVDLSTDNGRLIARITGAVARAEIERKSARQQRAALQRAEQGRVHSGGRRPFGYHDKVTVHKDEAKLVRRAYALALRGEALYSIAAQWNDAGVTTTTGGRWRSSTLRQVLVNPRYAGLRSYRGEILKDVDGQAQWPALVDVHTWEAVHNLITQPGRRKNLTPGRKYLLTGIAVCGVCDAPLASGSKGTYTTYVCKSKGCFAVTRHQGPVDELVVDLVLAYLSRPDAADLLVDQGREDLDALRRRERVLLDRLDALAVDYADELLDRRGYQVARERVESQLAEVTAKMHGGDRHRLLEDLVKAKNPRKVWAKKSLDNRRAIIQTLMRPKVLPAGKGRRFRREQLVPGWVTGEE